MRPERWGQLALILAAFSLFVGVGLYALFVHNRNLARDEACRASEGQHLEEIKDLTERYSFYVDPPRRFADVLKDPRAIQQLHDLERDARRDNDEYGVFVASVCDKPGFGRPEPDPKLPEKPAGVP